MKSTPQETGPTGVPARQSPTETADDKLTPSQPFLSCTDKANPRSETSREPEKTEGPEVCDSLAAAREAIYPVAAACVILLTILSICYSLYFTKAVMLPIVGAFLLNFLFSPVVLKMNRAGVPNVLGTFVVLGLAVAAILTALAFAYQPATTWLAEKDQNLTIVKRKLSVLQKPIRAIQDVTEQIDEISSGKAVEAETAPTDGGEVDGTDGESGLKPKSKETSENSSTEGNSLPSSKNPLVEPQSTFAAAKAGMSPSDLGPDRSVDDPRNPAADTVNTSQIEESDRDSPAPVAAVVPVEVQQPSISNRIFSTTGDTFAGVSLMLVLLFYLLSAGDRGLEKLVKLMPTFQGKRRVVELSRAIEKSVSDYLLTTSLINFGLGVVIGTGMWAIGMPNPILWGVMAMFLNYFPFIGAIIGAAIVFLAAVVSYESIAYAAWAPAIYLFANLIEANFITPVLLGRSVSLHPVWLMIFFVIVAWVWGLGGAIIAVPALAVIKITCDHVEPLMPVGEFLGR